jgi:hypothetical protein
MGLQGWMPQVPWPRQVPSYSVSQPSDARPCTVPRVSDAASGFPAPVGIPDMARSPSPSATPPIRGRPALAERGREPFRRASRPVSLLPRT